MKDSWTRAYRAHSCRQAFKKRCREARRTISSFLDRVERPYVGFSGGKDSLCLLILLSQMGETEVPVFTQADDLDWPEKESYCRRVVSELGFEDYEYRQSETSALRQLADGAEEIRGTFSHVIEGYVEDRRRDGVLMGLRKEEAEGRRMLRITKGKIYETGDGLTRCIPLADWSGKDVFALIVSTGTEYIHVYDNDDECPPHEIRFSWPLNPSFFQRSDASNSAAWLRRHYPQYFARLAAEIPHITTAT